MKYLIAAMGIALVGTAPLSAEVKKSTGIESQVLLEALVGSKDNPNPNIYEWSIPGSEGAFTWDNSMDSWDGKKFLRFGKVKVLVDGEVTHRYLKDDKIVDGEWKIKLRGDRKGVSSADLVMDYPVQSPKRFKIQPEYILKKFRCDDNVQKRTILYRIAFPHRKQAWVLETITAGADGSKIVYLISHGKRPSCRLEDMNEEKKKKILQRCEQEAGVSVPFKQINAGRAIGACEQARELRPKDSKVLYLLARSYRKAGKITQAMEFAKKAGEMGSEEGWYLLGYLWMQGVNNKKDYIAARANFEKASKMGYAPAEVALGILYANGWGVTKDYAMAERYFRMAISNGSKLAEKNLEWLKYIKSKDKTKTPTVTNDTNLSQRSK